MIVSCPGDAGRIGRQDGLAAYRPGLSQLEAVREALHIHRFGFDQTRLTYIVAHREGWYAAAAQAAQSEQAAKE